MLVTLMAMVCHGLERLGEEQYGLAIEYLQKCLRQPFGLFFGRMEQSLAHLALCLAYCKLAAQGASGLECLNMS